ncbi:VOC family protein [Rhodohalobacter sulfatireducens]|uniref:VOC family protein n=1 Tax=Rhodohalobacter sulfatireducens TaxID=2911366 RepID=A0ABS9KFL9_9BACT|nr:VOC family protein [Rhodohalobacter sulfatireducens]MCG2589664.1 VOC family protein [Rhodohalobacter sulfatireducens]
MKRDNKGIHHISIISGDAQINADFYVKKLGLRMVLKSVNQDDPGTYHLFYANAEGEPGSSITFFPWKRAVKSNTGTGEVERISFSVPMDSISYWQDRFESLNISASGPFERFGKNVLPFEVPDGLKLEIIEDDRSNDLPGWKDSDVPLDKAIRGFWGANLLLSQTEETAEILTDILGFEKTSEEGNQTLFETGSKLGHSVILEKADDAQYGKTGRGTVHHIAFRTKDEEELKEFRQQVIAKGLSPTNVIDRHVFKSVYFQTPGGVLFEMATDGPGYQSVASRDEKMGKELFLPDFLESKRDMIEQRLEPIEV